MPWAKAQAVHVALLHALACCTMAGGRVSASQLNDVASAAMSVGRLWRVQRRRMPRDEQEAFLDFC